jgi:hypothetical protein
MGQIQGHIPQWLKLKKCFLRSRFPQRLEAAVDWARFRARVEIEPFPFVPDSRVFNGLGKPPVVAAEVNLKVMEINLK